MDSVATHPPFEEFETLRQQRRERAWAAARLAAGLLKARYHASKVIVFGSLVETDRFNPWSDIDLAAWGIDPADYFEAVARVLDIGGDIKIDLVRGERSKPRLRDAVAQGVEL
jgi:uncharacterized protein